MNLSTWPVFISCWSLECPKEGRNKVWRWTQETAEHVGAMATEPVGLREKSHYKAATSPAASYLSLLSPAGLEICSKPNSFFACAGHCGDWAGNREERKELRLLGFLQVARVWVQSPVMGVSNLSTQQTWDRLPHLYAFLVPVYLPSAAGVREKNGFTLCL